MQHHRRTGRGGEGGGGGGAGRPPPPPPPPPPNFGQLRFLGQQEKIWAKPVFKTFPCLFYYYFEEIHIFYFNLKSA